MRKSIHIGFISIPKLCRRKSKGGQITFLLFKCTGFIFHQTIYIFELYNIYLQKVLGDPLTQLQKCLCLAKDLGLHCRFFNQVTQCPFQIFNQLHSYVFIFLQRCNGDRRKQKHDIVLVKTTVNETLIKETQSTFKQNVICVRKQGLFYLNNKTVFCKRVSFQFLWINLRQHILCHFLRVILSTKNN